MVAVLVTAVGLAIWFAYAKKKGRREYLLTKYRVQTIVDLMLQRRFWH